MIDSFEVILSEGESHTVEFKEAPDKTLPSEVCAFANASGGRDKLCVYGKRHSSGCKRFSSGCDNR